MAGIVHQRGVITSAHRPHAALIFELAGREDDAELRRLLAHNHMAGWTIGLSLECEPSFFDALAVEGDRCDVVIAREAATGGVVATGARSVREVYVNGEPQRLGYLGHLRIDEAWRRRSRVLREGYRFAGALRQDRADELPFDLTSIMIDNRPAMELLTAKLDWLPRYVHLDHFMTMAIPIGGGSKATRHAGSAFGIRIAMAADLPEIVECLNRNLSRFQFAARWTAEALTCGRRCRGLRISDFLVAEVGGELIGCAALWDQRAFKQAVARSYSWPVRAARPLANCVAHFHGGVSLPRIGKALNAAYLSHLAVDGDSADAACALVEGVLRAAAARGIGLVLAGFALRHPLLDPLRRAFRHRGVESSLQMVDWDRDGRLEASPRFPDDRPIHVEAATL